jgi:hypothetical protein
MDPVVLIDKRGFKISKESEPAPLVYPIGRLLRDFIGDDGRRKSIVLERIWIFLVPNHEEFLVQRLPDLPVFFPGRKEIKHRPDVKRTEPRPPLIAIWGSK